MNLRRLALVGAAGVAVGAGVYWYLERVRRPAAPASTGTEVGQPPLKLAATLPAISLADREGQLRTLDDWRGHSLIVNFWATWCAPCRREIPLLERLQSEYGSEGFQVIGIAVDFRDKVLAYADEMTIDYPLLIGEMEALDAAAAFGIEVVGLPFTVFSDAQGRIIAAHIGELTAAEADTILTAVRRVNAGTATPDQARLEIESTLKAPPATAAIG